MSQRPVLNLVVYTEAVYAYNTGILRFNALPHSYTHLNIVFISEITLITKLP